MGGGAGGSQRLHLADCQLIFTPSFQFQCCKLSFYLLNRKPKTVFLEAIMLPDVIEIRAKIKEFKDRLEILRGHL